MKYIFTMEGKKSIDSSLRLCDYFPSLVIGRLTLIEKFRYGKYHFKWKCRCECGKECAVDQCHLGKRTFSCGCLSRENNISRRTKKPYPEYRCLYTQYKTHAKQSKREFSLDIENFVAIVSKDCTYCGAEPVQKFSNTTIGYPYKANGVDRVDSSKGYSVDNCVPCCTMCNRMKLNFTVEVFKNQIKKIHDKFNEISN